MDFINYLSNLSGNETLKFLFVSLVPTIIFGLLNWMAKRNMKTSGKKKSTAKSVIGFFYSLFFLISILVLILYVGKLFFPTFPMIQMTN